MDTKRISNLTRLFQENKDVFIALGDETRLHIIIEMLKLASINPNCEGIRVGKICKISNLSRPAISHHMKYLKDSGIIKVNKKGTMNFYYLDADSRLNNIIHILKESIEICNERKK